MFARNATKRGLRGVLFLVNPRVLDLPWERLVNSVLQTEIQPMLPGFGDEWRLGPGALVRPEAIDRLLDGTGHTLRELSSLDKDGKPLPHFTMDAKIRVKTVFESGKVESPNVLAVLPGTDSKLKDEYVLLSAHLDHVGIGEPINGDNIYNGAMDNASGVATLLEAARWLRSAPPPKRSILFLVCTGEEEGEKGSLHFAERPTVDLKSIIANINLDMYLPLFPLKILRAYGLRESDLASYLDAAAKEFGIQVQDDPTPERNLFIRSDQYSFIKKGIPSLFLSFGYVNGTPEEKIINAWFEQRYHGPTDDTRQPVDKVAAAKFNQLMAVLAEHLANAAQRPQWNVDSFFRRFVQ
jgi:Zn-dependent M28 family amino/carboxypeptidase